MLPKRVKGLSFKEGVKRRISIPSEHGCTKLEKGLIDYLRLPNLNKMRDICSGWTPKSDSCVKMDFLGPEHCGRVSIILFAHGLKSALLYERDQRACNKMKLVIMYIRR